MSRGSPIEDDDSIARLEAICERVEGAAFDQKRLVKREEELLQIARKLVAIANLQIDHLEDLSSQFVELIQAHKKILSGQCVLLDRKVIMEALDAYEARNRPLDHKVIPRKILEKK